MAKKKENTTSIGFEDAIWRAADKLRGNLNASEYEGVVLGLIFLKYISDTFEAFRSGTLADEAGYCAVKSLQDIAAQDYILTPGRYVGIAEQEDDGEPFAEKMQRLTSELSGLFAESHRLEDEIRKQLGSIGYEIA
jgi:type I restriction-modification system DNA methylase subunit